MLKAISSAPVRLLFGSFSSVYDFRGCLPKTDATVARRSAKARSIADIPVCTLSTLRRQKKM